MVLAGNEYGRREFDGWGTKVPEAKVRSLSVAGVNDRHFAISPDRNLALKGRTF